MDDRFTLPVREWDEGDKPREKMIDKGKKSLSNAELIAILLRSGVQGKSAVEMAREVLACAGNSLVGLAQMEYAQLHRIKGMAEAKCTSLMAALELGWRMQGEQRQGEVLITGSETAFLYMLPLLADLDHEEFWGIFLNVRNKVISRQRISIGGQTSTPVDLRVLFRAAIESKAVRLVVVHNHPSGSLAPSRQDHELTERVDNAGNLLGIKLIDHLIIGIGPTGKADYHSFADSGQLPRQATA